MEGQRSGVNATGLLQTHGDGRMPELGRLEGSWMNLPEDAVRDAYAWALANIEYIVQTEGMTDVVRILDRIASGELPEAALRSVLRDSYGDLEQATSQYLQKTYGR
jgi:hypothetical protein